MMRPDRFTAVFCLSVPFIQPGGPSFLQTLREAGRSKFYMFRQIRPEADREWANATVTIPGMLYWTSGSAPEAERWDPFDPARGLLRASPIGVPDFADADDVAAAIKDFTHKGFNGPLNYYRAIEPFSAMANAFAGATIRQPSFFMVGTADGLNKMRAITEEALRPGLPGLRGFIALDGVGHWPQLEATEMVDKALIAFLNDLR